jgi:Flp pilus assembly secretin CpaC
MKVTTVALAAFLAFATLVPAAPALAQDGPITVKANMARILRISAPAATVIIGNPGVADVTIQDPQTLVLTGKSYGQTNLIVLDTQGNPIADTMIEVIQETADVVTMYLGNARTTLACSPTCQPTIMLGDDLSFSNSVVASSNLVEGAAR